MPTLRWSKSTHSIIFTALLIIVLVFPSLEITTWTPAWEWMNYKEWTTTTHNMDGSHKQNAEPKKPDIGVDFVCFYLYDI